MIRRGVKIILLSLGLVSLIFIAKETSQPFWQSPNYIQSISNFRNTWDIIPYRLKNIWWSQSIIPVSIIERGLHLLLAGHFFHLPLLLFLILIKKKKWFNLGLIFIGLMLISIEKDPNPGKYLLWLTPLVLAGFIK